MVRSHAIMASSQQCQQKSSIRSYHAPLLAVFAFTLMHEQWPGIITETPRARCQFYFGSKCTRIRILKDPLNFACIGKAMLCHVSRNERNRH